MPGNVDEKWYLPRILTPSPHRWKTHFQHQWKFLIALQKNTIIFFCLTKLKAHFPFIQHFLAFFVITIYCYFWVCLINKLPAYLKVLPLEKLTIFLLEIYQKLCYFIHEYACFRPSAILLKFTKNPKDSGRSTIVRSTKLLR